MQRLAKAPKKNLIGFTSEALEWRFVEAVDGRAEGRGNGSALEEKPNERQAWWK